MFDNFTLKLHLTAENASGTQAICQYVIYYNVRITVNTIIH